MRRGFIIIGLAVLLFALVSRLEAKDGDESETQQTNRQLVDVAGQGHENTSGRNVRQFEFGYPPPPPPFGFGGPGYGGPGYGGPGYGGPGFGGPGFGGPGFGGPGFGGGYGGGFGGGLRVRERYRVRERVVTRTRHNRFGGGFYG